MRVGYGYDVHRLVPERDLILCGVSVPYELGLLGHSDADVALHALMDAMLGACALGDIGAHFPDTDERYRGVSSLLLLKETVRILAEAGYRVYNADVTIVAQKPKLLPYIPRMKETVAEAEAVKLIVLLFPHSASRSSAPVLLSSRLVVPFTMCRISRSS